MVELSKAALSRRTIGLGLITLPIAAVAGSVRAATQPASEIQWSGDGAPEETLNYDPDNVERIVLKDTGRAKYEPKDKSFATNFLASCQSFIGTSRATTPERISDYLGLFNLPFADNGKVVPFCAAGLSFAAATSYAKALGRPYTPATEQGALRDLLGEIDRYHFYPSPSVLDIYYVAQGKRRWVDRQAAGVPRPGWLVIYDWKKNGGANHVAVVERATASRLETIEFNTAPQAGSGDESNGGLVTRRIRPLDGTVKGFVKTDKPSPFEMDT